MELSVGTFDLLKLGFKLINHKFLQYRLRTSETHVLHTNDGLIKGVKRKTVYTEYGHYYAFEGIPYAKPPLGDLRFRAPQAAESWDGIRDCTYCRSKPLQQHHVLKITEGSEDCLYINVYTKKLHTTKPMPVLVWIYGGGFQIGEATRDYYSPDYFMKTSVVLVQLNYRLGALGFLSLNDPDIGIPGNAGLKDQLMALHWIKENIASFNGDPNNITLFGESAGAASIHCMMLNEKAKGLFHKAILQSGSVLCPWAVAPSKDWAYRLALCLNYNGSNNDKEVYRFLRKINARQITSNDNRLLTEAEKREHILFSFLPVIEPYDSADCIIAKPFIESLANAWGNQIPLIIGGNSFEGLFLHLTIKTHPHFIDELGDCTILLPAELRSQDGSLAEQRAMAAKLKHAHFGESAPCFNTYLDLASYKMFWHGLHRTVRARQTYTPSHIPTYLYRFDFDSPNFNHYRILSCGSSVRGVAHADDVSYLFYNISAWKLPRTSPEYRTIVRMIGMWTSFAADSNPNCTQIAPCVWEPLQSADAKQAPKCLNISDKFEFIELPEHKKLTIWDSLYEQVKLF